MHRNWSVLHPREPSSNHLVVAAGARVPYGQVRVVAQAAASAGYDEIDLLVRAREPGPSQTITSYWSLMER
jgi:biopolymer transport protein ExbD